MEVAEATETSVIDSFWAKTTADGQLGISVRDHCVNVGCVAEALLATLSDSICTLLPRGGATLAALHDIGKISCGFQVKCPAWLSQHGLSVTALHERWGERLQAGWGNYSTTR